MNKPSRKPHKPAGTEQATYVLDREGRIIETNEMLLDLSFCRQDQRLGLPFAQRLDHDSAAILKNFLLHPGETLTGKVDFCYMRGDGYFYPAVLTIQALRDADAVVGFVVHVEPAASPPASSPREPGRSKP